jgi:hypothetical protein
MNIVIKPELLYENYNNYGLIDLKIDDSKISKKLFELDVKKSYIVYNSEIEYDETFIIIKKLFIINKRYGLYIKRNEINKKVFTFINNENIYKFDKLNEIKIFIQTGSVISNNKINELVLVFNESNKKFKDILSL